MLLEEEIKRQSIAVASLWWVCCPTEPLAQAVVFGSLLRFAVEHAWLPLREEEPLSAVIFSTTIILHVYIHDMWKELECDINQTEFLPF